MTACPPLLAGTPSRAPRAVPPRPRSGRKPKPGDTWCLGGKLWTDEEREILRRLYTSKGWKAVQKELPYRTERSICLYARKLGLAGKDGHPHWREDEDHLLRVSWGDMAVESIARKLGRSIQAVLDRAHLHHRLEPWPEDLLSTTMAEKHSGFSMKALLPMLEHAGVEPVRVLTYRRTSRFATAWRVEDVDRAVHAWNTTETVVAAARARDVPDWRLREWLFDAGIRHPPGHTRGQHWRVASTVIDRVIKERREAIAKTVTLRQMSLRTGVPIPTFLDWMREAGIASRRYARHDPAVLQALIDARAGMETREHAAKRYHTSPARIRRWLREAGLDRFGARSIPSADIDKAATLAKRRRGITLAEAARRHGVTKWKMQRWLEPLVSRNAGPRWRLNTQTVDRIAKRMRRGAHTS